MLLINDTEKLQYAVKDCTVEKDKLLNHYKAVHLYYLSMDTYQTRNIGNYERYKENWNYFAKKINCTEETVSCLIGHYFSLPSNEKVYWIDSNVFNDNPDNLDIIKRYKEKIDTKSETPIILTFDYEQFYQLDKIIISNPCEFILSKYSE